MNWTSIIAIYVLFWVMTAFAILPIGIRSQAEMGVETEKGHDPGAPTNFRPGVIALRTTIVSAMLFGLFYANYHYGWFDRRSLDFLIVD